MNGPTERTPKPEYLISLAPYSGVRWDSVPFNFSWTEKLPKPEEGKPDRLPLPSFSGASAVKLQGVHSTPKHTIFGGNLRIYLHVPSKVASKLVGKSTSFSIREQHDLQKLLVFRLSSVLQMLYAAGRH